MFPTFQEAPGSGDAGSASSAGTPLRTPLAGCGSGMRFPELLLEPAALEEDAASSPEGKDCCPGSASPDPAGLLSLLWRGSVHATELGRQKRQCALGGSDAAGCVAKTGSHFFRQAEGVITWDLWNEMELIMLTF